MGKTVWVKVTGRETGPNIRTFKGERISLLYGQWREFPADHPFAKWAEWKAGLSPHNWHFSKGKPEDYVAPPTPEPKAKKGDKKGKKGNGWRFGRKRKDDKKTPKED